MFPLKCWRFRRFPSGCSSKELLFHVPDPQRRTHHTTVAPHCREYPVSGLAKSSPSILSASTLTCKLWGLSLARLSERDCSRVLAVTVLTVGSRPLREPHRLQVQLLVRLLCLRGKGFYTRWPIRFKLGQKFLDGVFHGAAHGKYNRDHNLSHDTWQEPLSEVSLGRSFLR